MYIQSDYLEYIRVYKRVLAMSSLQTRHTEYMTKELFIAASKDINHKYNYGQLSMISGNTAFFEGPQLRPPVWQIILVLRER
jgi:hypothetical protein